MFPLVPRFSSASLNDYCATGIFHFDGRDRAYDRCGQCGACRWQGVTLVYMFVTLLADAGMLLVNFFEPGGGMHRISMSSASGISTSGLNLPDFVNHLVPDSIFHAMSDNEILQIVVFSIIFGCAAAALPEKSKLVLEWVRASPTSFSK